MIGTCSAYCLLTSDSTPSTVYPVVRTSSSTHTSFSISPYGTLKSQDISQNTHSINRTLIGHRLSALSRSLLSVSHRSSRDSSGNGEHGHRAVQHATQGAPWHGSPKFRAGGDGGGPSVRPDHTEPRATRTHAALLRSLAVALLTLRSQSDRTLALESTTHMLETERFVAGERRERVACKGLQKD